MKKTMVLVGLTATFLVSTVTADGLKNSLTNIMHEKEQSPVVDLGEINLNAKPKHVKKVHKTRSSKSVIATINGHKIIKKDVDEYLSKRTQGKITNFDAIPRQQQKRLIDEVALPVLISDAAEKELSAEEKQSVFSSMWMRKEASTVAVSDAQVMDAYNQLKKEALDRNVTRPLPEFNLIKERLRMQVIERSIVKKLVDDAKIEVLE